MSYKIKVMMTTEGTYPFHHGGVSTWCDMLIKDLNKDMDFLVYSIIMNPYVTQKFHLPPNTDLIKVPLWGTVEPNEHLNVPFSQIYISQKRTTDEIIKEKFIPLFIELIEEIISYEKNPVKFANTLYEMYKYFKEYEYKKSFKSEITWNVYKELINKYTSDENNNIKSAGSYSLVNSLGWIYRFLTILNTPIPKVDVTHSAAAAFCGIPCILAKFEYNAPFILTEHGVYLREQYLSLSNRGYSSFLNTFLIRFIHSVVNVNYYYADQVSPVCNYNTRWERKFGVQQDKINIIYNGVGRNFLPEKSQVSNRTTPTVVSVARIDPIKDIITLLKAAALVKKEIPDVKFLVYGSVTVQDYYEECLKLKEDLSLGDNFVFAGHTSDVAKAYQAGDIVVLSSISEAFPYSVVEAMMAGKPVVATDVGGVNEAIGSTGIVVPPRDVVKLSKGILTLLLDTELRASLSEEAMERALNLFTIKRFHDLYYKSYLKLVLEANVGISTKRREDTEKRVLINIKRRKQRLLIEKGLALFEYGYYRDAIEKLREAIDEDYESLAVPYILTKIADAYNKLGKYENGLNEIEKAQYFIEVLI
jgi:glycosyltransferase involved in cell wall biosynthesis